MLAESRFQDLPARPRLKTLLCLERLNCTDRHVETARKAKTDLVSPGPATGSGLKPAGPIMRERAETSEATAHNVVHHAVNVLPALLLAILH